MLHVRMSLELDEVVTGQQLIDAVKQLSGDHYQQVEGYEDEATVFMIGKTGASPADDLVIVVENVYTYIDPEYTYFMVEVVHTKWETVKDNPWCTNPQIVETVKNFRDKLQQLLNDN